MRTSSACRHMLYYSTDSGSAGRFRRGDGHEMATLLQHDLLNRLVDAACAASREGNPIPPDEYLIETWAGFITAHRRQAERALGHNPGSLLRFWEQAPAADGAGSEPVLFHVGRDSAEFQAVSSIFLAEPPQARHYGPGDILGRWSGTEVTRIQRIQNGCQREGLQARHDCLRHGLRAQGVTFKEQVHARWLFHGPGSAEALDSILHTQEGFNPLLSGSSVGQLWGAGIYFARDAQYVAEPPYVVTTDQGEKQVLLCLVEVGMPCAADPKHVGAQALLPFRHAKHRYNSTVDSLSNPEIFVVQQNWQAIPSYLISFC